MIFLKMYFQNSKVELGGPAPWVNLGPRPGEDAANATGVWPLTILKILRAWFSCTRSFRPCVGNYFFLSAFT